MKYGSGICIIGPTFFSYTSAISECLRSMNYNVRFINERGSDSFIVKTIYRSSFLKLVLNFILKRRYQEIVKEIKDSSFSHVLFISPEYISKDIINEIKSLGCHVSLYMWDSLSNKPAATSYLSFFDSASTFDPVDAKKYGLTLINLFAENVFFENNRNEHRVNDICFVGTAHSKRPVDILKLLTNLKLKNYKIKIHLYSGNLYYEFRAKILTRFSNILPITRNSITKSEVSTLFSASNCVLDITHKDQNGLTSRTFEALASNCNLLTNNKYSLELLPEFASRIYFYEEIESINNLLEPIEITDTIDLSYLSINRFCEEIIKLLKL